MEEGQIVVKRSCGQSSGLSSRPGSGVRFSSVKALLQTAKHGKGENVYLIRFHDLPPGDRVQEAIPDVKDANQTGLLDSRIIAIDFQ
jgi:hypothetical protein